MHIEGLKWREILVHTRVWFIQLSHVEVPKKQNKYYLDKQIDVVV